MRSRRGDVTPASRRRLLTHQLLAGSRYQAVAHESDGLGVEIVLQIQVAGWIGAVWLHVGRQHELFARELAVAFQRPCKDDLKRNRLAVIVDSQAVEIRVAGSADLRAIESGHCQDDLVARTGLRS